jgi:hypothetical protein
MAVPGLSASQLVTETSAGAAGFVLKSGQSNVISLKCMTRSEAETRYHLMQTGTFSFSGYAANRLIPHELWVNRPTAWRGINTTCVIEDNTSLSAFNFMVIKYRWASGAGSDLDTFTGIVNTGIAALDNKFVGFGPSQTPQIPTGNSINTSYAFWAGDNTNNVAGSESVLINFSKIATDFPTLSTISTRMAAVWYAGKQSGNIELEIKTYSGGTMSVSGFDINNTGGTLNQTVTFSKNINLVSTSGLITNALNVGYVNFTKSSSTGLITIIYT